MVTMKKTYQVTVSDGRGGTRVDTRNSAHAYVAVVVRTVGEAYVADCLEQRAKDVADLAAARGLLAARTAALGGMTPAEAEAAAGGDRNVAAGLGQDGPFGICMAWHDVKRGEKRVVAALPVVGAQGAVSWHSSHGLAVKAAATLAARDASGSAALRDDTYEVRTDVTVK